MSVEDIIQFHGYDENIANYLRKAYPAFIAYFKDEELIYSALMNTPIKLTNKNIYECLKENGFLNREDDELVSYDTLKVASGVYHQEPIISFDRENNKFILEGTRRIAAINGNSLYVDKPRSMLTHELSHLIKSYYNENTIEGDILIQRSGLTIRKYKLSEKDGKVKMKIISEERIGLEEGYNTIAEEKIMSMIQGQPFESKGYQTMKNIALLFTNFNIPNLMDEIIMAELYHDDTKLESILGETFAKMIKFADEIYPLNVEILDMNTRDERREELKAIGDAKANEQLPSIVEELKAIGQSSMVM